MGESSGAPADGASSQVDGPAADEHGGAGPRTPWEAPGWAGMVVFALLGVVLAVVGGFFHNVSLLAGLPILAAAWTLLLAGLAHAAGRLTGRQSTSFALILVWAAVSLPFANPRAEGDLIIAPNLDGYLYFYGGFVAMLIATVLVPSRGPSWLLSSRLVGGGVRAPHGAGRPPG
ncbi:hypothetical protein [Spongiactinospora sp. 9N601]|uniref:hypothetical protein n=1 Tax=Spongiactinospora sp. 9N601 TaxID=3375149 RepID=UPI0037B37824